MIRDACDTFLSKEEKQQKTVTRKLRLLIKENSTSGLFSDLEKDAGDSEEDVNGKSIFVH